ncbi:MAG: carbohydrate kinase [Clostridiales Family XIII bacterium]|jgi:fructokinase|nr:carbohydrate kinase [Clostridiales Family XIII bacterium]
MKTNGISPSAQDKTYGLVALGETLVDFTEAGRSENGQRLFEQNPGGAPANMLSAVAQLGGRTAFIGKVGNDMHGRFLKAALQDAGIHTGGMILADDVFTTLAFVALTDGEREFSFARKPGADTRLTESELDAALLENCAVFHFGSLSLTDEPARSATYAAIRRAKAAGALISYDPNYRAGLWPGVSEAVRGIREPLPQADLLKVSDEEAAMLSGLYDPESAARALCREGIHLVAVTLGKDGALVCTDGRCQHVAGFPATAVDTTGAGDAFWGGFLYQFLQRGKARQTELSDAVDFARFGNAAAAICVSRRGGIPAMPSLEEVESLICAHE